MNSYWNGMIVTLAVQSLCQDYLGVEEYVRRVQENWISGWITVPVAIIAMVACLWDEFISARKDADGS